MRIHCILTLLVFVASLSYAEQDNSPAHLSRGVLPTGCGTCHVGNDFSNGGGPEVCISCHGGSKKMKQRHMASGKKARNVSAEFAKTFRHPTFDVQGVHNSREILPELNPNQPRHSDCSDCHNPHFVVSGKPFNRVRGKKVINAVAEIQKEYELCYRCHSDSLNLPAKSTNKQVEFSLNNPSFHPVEGEGRNSLVVSLMRPYKEKKTTQADISVIKCTDCHGSDDPKAARGPHGSIYRHILVENYETGDNIQERAESYALCYRCHKRSSILGNESFPFHGLHITGKSGGRSLKSAAVSPQAVNSTPNLPVAQTSFAANPLFVGFRDGGTSCYTCHNSHGSTENRYLIRFNRDIVSESSSGKLKFQDKGVNAMHGECWLTCHGVDHNPKSY